MYGAMWCPDCAIAKQVFAHIGLSYEWIDISNDNESAAYVERINGGNRSVPTIIFPDGSVLTEPSKATLQAKLDDLNRC